MPDIPLNGLGYEWATEVRDEQIDDYRTVINDYLRAPITHDYLTTENDYIRNYVRNRVDLELADTNRFNYVTTPRIDFDLNVLNEKFEHFSRKIYKIIEEHTPIDITEEEFMKLLKDDD